MYISTIEQHRQVLNRSPRLIGIGRMMFLSDEQYQNWLSGLKDGDYVVLQEFHPADDAGTLDYTLEYWRYSVYRLHQNTLIEIGDNVPISRETGMARYWDSDREWGKVFPARIVPLSPYFGFLEGKGDFATGQTVISDRPVYEPLLKYAYRHVYLRKHDIQRGELNAVIRNFRYYIYKVNVGELIHVFSDKEPDEMPSPENLLYSELIDK